MPAAPRRQRLGSVTTKKAGRARLKSVPPDKAPFPSPRQRLCKGLQRNIFPGYIQWAVDFDYADKLSPEDRAYLAAFSEEHYKGWFLKKETQVHPPDKLREANAAHGRRRRGHDVLSFEEHRHHLDISTAGPHESRNGSDDQAPLDTSEQTQLRVLAGSTGKDTHELRGRNVEEDKMVQRLDRPRRVK